MLVLDEAQRVADWVAAQSGNAAPTVDAAIGFEQDGALKAGVYFDALTDNNIFAHIASTANTLPRSLLVAVVVYVFEQLRLTRMTFAVPADNHAAGHLVAGMGACLEGRLADACGRGVHLNLHCLRADDDFSRRLLAFTEPDHGK